MPKGISIHIGLNRIDHNHYGTDGALSGCENDAKAYKQIADSEKYASQIFVNEKATSKAVIGAISGAAKKLTTGDILLLTYSGHGAQVPDTNGDETEDGKDETWCLYDRMLIDDELYSLWSQFETGVRIFVLSDSCHSGSVLREALERATSEEDIAGEHTIAEPRFRALTRAESERTYKKNKAKYDKIQKDNPAGSRIAIGASVLLISGCQDNQLSADGDDNGKFTETLLKVWADGAFKGGYALFHRKIAQKMPPWQSPNLMQVGKASLSFVRQKPFVIK